MVPNSEVETDGDDSSSDDTNGESEFPSIKSVEDLYKLEKSPYEKAEYLKDKAQHYINQYQDKMDNL